MPTKRASVLRVRDWQGETAQQQPSTPLSSSTSPAQHLMLGGGGVAEEGLAYMMPDGPLPPPAYQMPHEEREENTAEGVLVEENETQHRAEEGTTAVSMLAESSDEEDEEYGHRRQQDEPPKVEAYSIRDYAEGQRVNPPYDGEESREDSRDSHQVWRDAHLNRDGRGVHDQRMAPPQHKHQTEHNRSHNEPRSLGHKSQRAGDDAENRSMTTSHQTQRTPHHPQQQRPSYPPPSFEDSVNRTHPPHATASRNQHQQHHEAKSHTASPQYANQPPRPAPTMPPAPAPHTSLPAGGGVVPVHPGMQYVPGYPPHHQLPPGVAGPGYHGQPMPPPMPMPPMHHGSYPAPYGHPFVPPQGSPYGPPPLPPQAYAMGPVPSPAHHPPYSPIPMQGGMPPPAPGYGAPLPPPPMRPSAGGAPAPNDGFRQKAMSLREFIPADERIKCLHIAPPPDKVVSAVSGGGERDNNSKRAFPTQEAIRAYFGPNVLTVEILNGNHPINPSYAFIEFDTREHAVQSFLQLGLFVKIADVPLKLGWSKTYREPIIKPKQQQQPMFNPAQMSRLSPQEQLLAEQYAQFLQQDKARGGANQQEGTPTNAHYPPNRGVPQGPHHSNHPPAAFEQRGQGRENRHASPMEHNHTNNSNFRGYPPPPQSHSSQPAPYTPYPPYGGHADGGRTDGDMRPPHRGPRTEAQHPTPPYHQHQYHPQQHHQQHQQQPQHNHSQPQPLPQHQPQSVGRHPHPHPHQQQHQQHGGPHHAPTHRRGEDADRRPPPPSYADDVRRPPSRF